MPKYKAEITETTYRVTYVIVEAEDEGDAWDKAESEMYLVPNNDFAEIDGSLEVSDLAKVDDLEDAAQD